MPSKKPRMCPICHRPGLINLSQHLNRWCSQDWWTRKKMINSERNSRVGSDGNGTSISYREAHQLPRNASTWTVIENTTDEKTHTRRIESNIRTLFEYE